MDTEVNNTQGLIPGGFIKAYRKTLKSDMYQALTSSQRDVFWTCLLLASHESKQWEWNGEIFTCEPGQFITSLESIRKSCASDTTIQKIRTTLLKLEKWQFLTSTPTKQGRLISIINWGSYQQKSSLVNKASNKQLTNSQHLSRRSKKNKNIKAEKISAASLREFLEKNPSTERYSDSRTIESALSAIISTRKSGVVSSNVLQKILSQWERLPAEQVLAGIQTYLRKGYAEQGKDERYLAGIIRNSNGQGQHKPEPQGTGSKLLDEALKQYHGTS